MNLLERIYHFLFERYGPQGWWPLLGIKGTNPTWTGKITGYHTRDYSFPRTKAQEFEIWVGAILTQNTAWTQVERALINLQDAHLLNPEALLQSTFEELADKIRPAGYFNQKSHYLRESAGKFLDLNERVPSRKEILAVRGIGEETADSILLYAYHQPEFVVDAYTKRILSGLGLCPLNEKYGTLKKLLEASLPRDPVLYQEFHALFVEHAKRYYSRKPWGVEDPLVLHLQTTGFNRENP